MAVVVERMDHPISPFHHHVLELDGWGDELRLAHDLEDLIEVRRLAGVRHVQHTVRLLHTRPATHSQSIS